MQDEAPYIGIVIIMILNKISLSFFGAKVRQHLINPGFVKNQSKFQELADLQVTTASRFPRSRILTATDASLVSEDPSESLLEKAQDAPVKRTVMDGEIDAEVLEENSDKEDKTELEEFPQADFSETLDKNQITQE